MQRDPRYDDVVAEVAAFLEERLAFAVAAGDRRGARSASTRASASARRPTQNLELLRRLDVARRARPAGARRPLAQEHDRPRARRPGRRATGTTAARSALRWPRSTAARRSSASTTCARTSRRSRSPRPSSGAASRDGRGARDRAARLPRRARGGAAGRASGSSSTSGSTWASGRPRATGSRTPSTTATVVARRAGGLGGAGLPPARGAGASALADALLARFPVERVARARCGSRTSCSMPPVEPPAVSVGAACGRDRATRVGRARERPRRRRGETVEVDASTRRRGLRRRHVPTYATVLPASARLTRARSRAAPRYARRPTDAPEVDAEMSCVGGSTRTVTCGASRGSQTR